MKIIHNYIAKEIGRNVFLCSAGFCFLFLIFDFLDRIDNIITEEIELLTVISYFLLKLPQFFTMTLPVAMLLGTLFTIGLLSKNSEITAMRAAGLRVFWIARPVLILAFCLSLIAIFVNETVVPYSSRRVREIYNIDIKHKDKSGTYSRNDFWVRSGDNFFSINMFDSRTDSLLLMSEFKVNKDFQFTRRIDTPEAKWLGEDYGWTMKDVTHYNFTPAAAPKKARYPALPLVLNKNPKNFYSAKTDPFTMSYRQLKAFIKDQKANGINTKRFYADLYSKLSFSFVILFGTLAVLPFALKPARSGSLAVSFVAGIIVAFSYFLIHSFSLALGRAEIWPPLFAAWAANLLMFVIGIILNAGGESPQ